jgi:hypothetical protein
VEPSDRPDERDPHRSGAVGPHTFWTVGNHFELTAYEERTFTMVGT